MTVDPIQLPGDVVDYINSTFAVANREVSQRLDRMPTTHEEMLDVALIDAISLASGPHVVASGAVVDVDIHFLGGGRHFGRWEVADIGLILNFRRGRTLLRTKVVLFQSKRLYPIPGEEDFVDERGLTRVGGFGSLMDPSPLAAMERRTFHFQKRSRYKAMHSGDTQWNAILEYEETFKIPVYYLLYHPSRLPYARELPLRVPIPRRSSRPPRVGARVLPAKVVRERSSSSNTVPSFSDLCGPDKLPGRRVEEFVTEEVLACREGYIADEPRTDQGLFTLFNQRSGPIAAAIRFDIDLPEEATEHAPE